MCGEVLVKFTLKMHGDYWVHFTLMYTENFAKKCFDMCIGHVGMHMGNLLQQECKLMNLPYVMQIFSPSTQQVPSRKANDVVVLSYLTPFSNSMILLMQHWICYRSPLIKEQFGIYILFMLFCKNEGYQLFTSHASHLQFMKLYQCFYSCSQQYHTSPI